MTTLEDLAGRASGNLTNNGGGLGSALSPTVASNGDRIKNPVVLQNLPEAESGDRLWAYLIEEGKQPNDERLFTFLTNPEELQWQRSAIYSEAATAVTTVQAQQYYHTRGRTLQLNDLLMETWFSKRSLRPLLEGLQKLLVPNLQSKVFAPPVLRFVWGTQNFGPCVLTDLDWRETGWLNGEPATIRLSMTLTEIPPPDSDLASRIVKQQKESKTAKDDLKTPLTDRQRADASTEAQKWLNTNQKKLPQQIQERLKTKRYKLSTDPKTGSVTMTDEKSTALGIVGKWDGRAFATASQTLIPQEKK